MTTLDGTLLETIGTGERGSLDGAFAQASFYRPQGLALDGESLYVADTENHLIRRLDLRGRKVETIAGTGKQMEEYNQEGGARSISLNSPWDLALVGRMLYIAMAGPHQIWKLDLEKREISTFAGSGREARLDGKLAKAGFAQPSGLATDGQTLYVADSESNIIRAIELGAPDTEVRTLAGGDLFEFGDRDGTGDEVRLQHPLGLLMLNIKVLIADTYNHKNKQLDPQAGEVQSLYGTGKPGQADGAQASFYEPGGLTYAQGKLYVADTNNHAIRVIDLKTQETRTLRLKGLQPPASALAQPEGLSSAPNREELKLAPQPLRAQGTGALVLDIALPLGYHLNASAPQRYQISVEGASRRLAVGDNKKTTAMRTAKDLQFPLRIPLHTFAAGKSALRIQLTLYYCREDNTGTCQIKTLVWRAPVEVINATNAPHEIRARAEIKQ
jgi:DNA-binding beta-propeller fold protein YncE